MDADTRKKIATFEDMVVAGDYEDAKIAELAGVPASAVAEFRQELRADKASENKPSAATIAEIDPIRWPGETADEDRELLEAARKLRDGGYKLRDGELVPPTARARRQGSGLVLRLKRQVRYQGRGKNDRPVDLVLIKSIYRDEMAEKVRSIAPADAIEIISEG